MNSTFIVSGQACRLCGGAGDTTPLMHFDELPVAGVYVPAEAPGPDPAGPLTLWRCHECGLVQLAQALRSDFYEQYRFVSGVASAYSPHLTQIAETLAAFRPAAKVLEIGASDGTLLSLLHERGLRVAGYEPSRVAAGARRTDVPVIEDVFDETTAPRSPLGVADIVVVRHVLEHLNDFAGLFAGLRLVADESTRLLIEVPDLTSTATQRIYGNVYHPHACYFDVGTLETLLRRHGWTLSCARLVPIFGGSVLGWARPSTSTDDAVHLFGTPLEPASPAMLAAFAHDATADLDALRAFFLDQKRQGYRIAGWGAAERTGAVLGMAGLGSGEVSCLYDRNPALQGLTLAGSRVPVRDPQALAVDAPDVLAIFARSAEDEIVAGLAGYRARGGRIVSLRSRVPAIVEP